MPRAELVADLGGFPDTARTLVLGALGAAGPDDPALDQVAAHYLELDGELATAYLVTATAMVRVQATRTGTYQRTLVPVGEVLRVDELFQDGRLTAVVEMNADRTVVSVVAATIDGRVEAEGAMVRNGWVVTAAGPDVARLSAFVAATRAAVAG